MIPLLEENAARIRALCEQYRVQRLEVFGSAAAGDFQPGKSDVDFLVELEPRDPVAYGRAYFDLLFALQDLLAVSVDLVEIKVQRNPYLLKSINESRQLLYEAA